MTTSGGGEGNGRRRRRKFLIKNKKKNKNLLPFQLTVHNNLTANFTKYVCLILKDKLQPKTSLKWVQVVKVMCKMLFKQRCKFCFDHCAGVQTSDKQPQRKENAYFYQDHKCSPRQLSLQQNNNHFKIRLRQFYLWTYCFHGKTA